MGHQLATLVTSCMVYYLVIVTAAQQSFNVVDYGAVGDGKTNDANAFSRAWKDVCNFKNGSPSMIIPGKKTFLVNPLTFEGPCKANYVDVKIEGSIIAPIKSAWNENDSYRWLSFDGIDGLNISGPGLIDGQGSSWWKDVCEYDLKQGCSSSSRPLALEFAHCNGVTLNNMKLTNSPQFHIFIMGCSNVQINTISIRAPGDSPNTDGIHIQYSQYVTIKNSDIETVDTAYCGLGHGISIGSLGMGPSGPGEAQVENITVRFANFEKTTNGARIKTWQGGSGYAKNISFEHMNFTNVRNPLIIDQYYCDKGYHCNLQKTSGVHISNVTYSGFQGTSSSKVAVNLNCSQAVPCTGIVLDTVELRPVDSSGEVISSCSSAYGRTKGVVEPQSCLKSK